MKKYIKAVFVTPVELFLKTEAKSGILLAVCAGIAMGLANSRWSNEYIHVLNIKILNLTLQAWVNDALMVIFFFVIGMEIKKELVVGELRSPQRAALPVAAALGGMIFPALIYYFLNPNPPDLNGWGIPMATDIAFALGVLSLFGKRVPTSLKIFLLAIAIVDDLGAILVIAFFYAEKINGYGLGLAALIIGFTALVKSSGIRSYWVYTTLGALAWLGVFISGVHATIAGVVLGLLTPLSYPTEKNASTTYSPLDDLVHTLHPWVSYGIMPVFALANSGIILTGTYLSQLMQHPIHQGVAIGLILGKPAGIIVFSAIAIKIGVAKLPSDLNWNKITAVGLLAGIGFTMSIFISNLALSPEQEIYSKTGIVLGSIVSAVTGSIFLFLSAKRAAA